jgi:hypothetical protein
MLNGILIGLAVLLSVLAVVRWTARAAAQDERSIRAPLPIRPVSSTRSARPDGPPWRRTSARGHPAAVSDSPDPLHRGLARRGGQLPQGARAAVDDPDVVAL